MQDVGTIICTGSATIRAVGGNRAPYLGNTGALYSKYDKYSIAGGAPRTVSVKSGFLGLTRAQLRRYGGQISVSFADNGLIAKTGGSPGPYTVSDYGDLFIQATPGVAFDIYRWPTKAAADKFGVQVYTTTVVFPVASGAVCPPGWR